VIRSGGPFEDSGRWKSICLLRDRFLVDFGIRIGCRNALHGAAGFFPVQFSLWNASPITRRALSVFSEDGEAQNQMHDAPKSTVRPRLRMIRRRRIGARKVKRKNWLNNGNPPGDPRNAPRCGAKTRSGKPCQAPGMANGRCRMHGGASTGPRTAEGLANSRRSRWKHGRYSASKIQNRRSAQRWVNLSRFLTGRLRYPPSQIRAMELLDALSSNSERSSMIIRTLILRIPRDFLGATSGNVLAPPGRTKWKGKES
jgi:hypothetical protein